VGNKLSALAAMQRGGDADLDPKLVGSVRLAFADALHFGGMQGIDLDDAGRGEFLPEQRDMPNMPQKNNAVSAIFLRTVFSIRISFMSGPVLVKILTRKLNFRSTLSPSASQN
jgi:hypothetical protein